MQRPSTSINSAQFKKVLTKTSRPSATTFSGGPAAAHSEFLQFVQWCSHMLPWLFRRKDLSLRLLEPYSQYKQAD
jgi:hypothetical protein